MHKGNISTKATSEFCSGVLFQRLDLSEVIDTVMYIHEGIAFHEYSQKFRDYGESISIYQLSLPSGLCIKWS